MSRSRAPQVTVDDLAALSRNQQNALSEIACNNRAGVGCARSTLQSLVRRGLIEPHTRLLPGGRYPVEVVEYEVPTNVHIVWAEWCAAR